MLLIILMVHQPQYINTLLLLPPYVAIVQDKSPRLFFDGTFSRL